MRTMVAGLGVQGNKRIRFAGKDVVATVDPVVPEAQYASVRDVPLDSYEAALICTPDAQKIDILSYLLSNGKHVLVEKPLTAPGGKDLRELASLARDSGAACYTAYNHRFEPHIMRIKEALDAGAMGAIYTARLFYGNGTAADVKHSPWRDSGSGVLHDLGSHLLDIVLFLFGPNDWDFDLWHSNGYETRTPDHVVFASPGRPLVQMEGTLLSWRNSFYIDILGERGSAHVNGLCKWGPSTFTIRQRVLPSGVPGEEVQTLECDDPTWELEYAHFKEMCESGGTNLENDLWIDSVLAGLSEKIGGAKNKECSGALAK